MRILHVALRRLQRTTLVACVLSAACLAATPQTRASDFAALIERLSEPGGDFAGDNLISNEQSYLHVMPALERAGVKGGAFIGIGTEQNFSYIAQIKPEIAYLIDIRRENMILHLLFKAIFAEAPTRIGYVCMLTGRRVPDSTAGWKDATIEAVIKHVDDTPPLPPGEQQQLQSRLETVIRSFGVPLTVEDMATISRSTRPFVMEGLSLVFQARGQPRRSYYPTLRTLLRESDGTGRQLSFLASEPAFQQVRSMHARNLIVPVVGDISGTHAMRAIAADIAARRLRLSGFYVSNVEFYLFPKQRFGPYAENLKQLPHDDRSVVIRSVFPSGGSRSLPQAVPGYYSTSVIQPFSAMLADLQAGRYRTYRDVVAASRH